MSSTYAEPLERLHRRWLDELAAIRPRVYLIRR